VSCNVTWYILNTHTNQTTTASAEGSATVNFKLGVLWAKGTITGDIVTSPQNQTSSPYTPVTVLTSPGGGLTCTISSATATDTSTFTYGSTTVNGSGTDTVSYDWTASAGTFANPNSASTTWTAPSVADIGSNPITLTCTISATAPAVTSPDGGNRGPSTTSATVQVYIPEVQITLDKSQVMNGKSITGTLSLEEPSSLPSGVSVTVASVSLGDGSVSISPSSVTVPGDGSSVPITITGASTSSFVNDISIAATGGAYSSGTPFTVYDLIDEECNAVPNNPSSYYFQADDGSGGCYFGPDPQGSIDIYVDYQAEVTPAGADASSLQIALVQNLFNCSVSFDYAAPTVYWNGNAVAGTTYTIPQDGVISWGLSSTTCDYTGAGPYVDGPNDIDSYQYGDGPSEPCVSTATYSIYNSTGVLVGTALYSVGQATISESFGDWAAILDSDDNSVSYPANCGWDLDLVRSEMPEGPEASGGASGSPITTGPSSNTLTGDAQSAAVSNGPHWSSSLINETP